MMDNLAPLAAQANTLAKQGQWQQASDKLAVLIAQITGHTVQTIQINRDQYSLNSLNGFTQLDTSEELFFKYHHEEGEEKSIEEYYRAELLKNHGFPVDLPLYACKEPGRQLLLYRKRNTQRFADVCRRWEEQGDAATIAKLTQAQQQLDQLTFTKANNSLHRASAQLVKNEAIHQLFYNRLIDDEHPPGFGARVAKFYLDKTMKLGNQSIDWSQFSRYHWQINGIDYPLTIAELFAQSAQVLAPQALANHGAVVAHGDAHNANVWFEDEQSTYLTLFDPAFAGENIPALLAEVKATFHNIFAHPYWLYEPDIAQTHYQVGVNIDHQAQQIVVQHNWQLTDLRHAFLESKINDYWRPLIARLKAEQLLPENYQQIIQLALFCCPTLVLDLTANGYGQQNEQSSALGWAIAVALGNGGKGPGQWISELM